MAVAELPEQSALGNKVARVEFPRRGIKNKSVEGKRAVLGAISGQQVAIKQASLLGFLARRNRPADGLGIAENPVLDGSVSSGRGMSATQYEFRIAIASSIHAAILSAMWLYTSLLVVNGGS